MTPRLELLARLRDLQPPPEPSWWPPAPGWWLAAALALLLVGVSIRWLPSRWRRWRSRRRILGALERIAARQRAGAPADAVIAEVSSLLRLAAMLRFPERDPGGRQGADWIAFLDACDAGHGAPGRFDALREALTVAPYAPHDPSAAERVDPSKLIRAARGWLRAAA